MIPNSMPEIQNINLLIQNVDQKFLNIAVLSENSHFRCFRVVKVEFVTEIDRFKLDDLKCRLKRQKFFKLMVFFENIYSGVFSICNFEISARNSQFNLHPLKILNVLRNYNNNI